MHLRTISRALLSLLFGAASASAQAPGVIIEPGHPLDRDTKIIAQAETLKNAGKLLSREKVFEMADKPAAGEALELPAPRTKVLTPQEAARAASRGFVRIGWFFLCPNCDKWHLNLAGGYAIDSKGSVATCHHCVKTDAKMREGYIIAVDANEKVYPVTAVIAANKDLDGAVVKVEGGNFEPLPLQDQISPGDSAFLFSEPFGHLGYFSDGIVNRFYWKSGDGGDPQKFEDAVRLRVNVSTDWAPGSSGAAIVDNRGNAIGHVSTIETRGNNARKEGGATQTMIAFHEAVPARGMMLMLKEQEKKNP